MTEIQKVKIGLSPELMNDISDNYDTETEKYGIESFLNECKATI